MTEETKSRWPLVEELFHRALGLECSSEERSSQVRNWADGDEELAREVISLLDSADVVEDSRSRAARSSATDEPVGRVLGGYRIVGLIGKGGMGTVYSAVRAMGGDDAEEQVALKVVRARLSSPLTRQRFLEERRMLAAMLHPHIARLLDGGVSEEGEPFFVMEYIHGERLDHYCQKTAHNHIEILKIFQQLLGAVAFAHRNRILHGDLKPSNVLVTAEGQVKLLDFGAAMLLSAQKDEEPVKPLAAFTPEYSSPEQVRGEICSAAADVYSLGALLYRLLTGSVLKAGEKAENKNIDADLEAIIAKATREKLEQRYASVSELDEEITRYIGHRPVLARSGTASYLFKKFLRRHRQGLILLLILAGSLLGAALAAQRQTRIARIQEAREPNAASPATRCIIWMECPEMPVGISALRSIFPMRICASAIFLAVPTKTI